MDTSGIKAGDIVKCDVRGQEFFALVSRPIYHNATLAKRVVDVEPLRPGSRLPSTFVTPRQITDHWRKSRRKGSA